GDALSTRRCCLGFQVTALPLANTRRFASQLAQVVKLGTPDVTLFNDVDVIHNGCMQREDSFHTDSAADLTHGNGLAHSAMLSGDHHGLKSLQALFGFRFFDAHVNADSIARLKLRKISA